MSDKATWKSLLTVLIVIFLGGCASPSGILTQQAPTFTPSISDTLPSAPTATQAIPDTKTPTSRPTSTSSPVPSKTSPPTALDLHAVVGVAANDVLNIRESPGAKHQIVGTIPPNGINVRVGGKSKEVNGSIWVPVNYRDKQGWVNKHFLALQRGKPDQTLLAISNQIVLALKNKNFSKVASLIHPQSCLRFSPYPTLLPQDKIFCPPQVMNLASDETQYLWGHFDGSGKPIEMTFSQYYEQFIYDVDFAHPEVVGFNQIIGTGNAINNIPEYYPAGQFVEYHFSGFDPQYGGMDWRSLRLVFVKTNQEWALVAIVHGEWTI